MDEGIHLNWPSIFNQHGWWAEPGPTKKSDKYNDQLREIEEYFNTAMAYAKRESYKEKDLKLEAMRSLFNGQKTLYVHADYVKEISDIINFKKQFHLDKLCIVGGYDTWMEASRFKENNISVLLRRVHSLPMRAEDAVDLPYALPSKLHAAGVEFGFQNQGDMAEMGTRTYHSLQVLRWPTDYLMKKLLNRFL